MMQASSTALRDRRAVSNVSADTRLNADPGERSSIPAWSHTFEEIYYLYGHSPPFRWFKKGFVSY